MSEEKDLQTTNVPAVSSEEKTPSIKSELENASADILCTIKGDDPVTKAKVFNALANPDYSLSDFTGKTVRMVDVLAQYVKITDDKTGEVSTQPRVIIIDDQGKAYSCVSIGVMNSLTQIFMVMGRPHYDIPLPLSVSSKKGRHGYNFLSLAIDVAEYQKLNK